jgi:D-glycero-D-manno-heptose 1,7-bisphosphate phosphatase
MITKLVILDRDGTINHDSDEYVKTAQEWTPMPGALEAIARLNHAGWHVVVASNQSGLGRGLFDVAALNAMHAKMHKMLGAVGGRVDAVFFCPHSPDENCSCRKPASGLFEQIGERYGMDLKGVPAVGRPFARFTSCYRSGLRAALGDDGQGRAIQRPKQLAKRFPSQYAGACRPLCIRRLATSQNPSGS